MVVESVFDKLKKKCNTLELLVSKNAWVFDSISPEIGRPIHQGFRP